MTETKKRYGKEKIIPRNSNRLNCINYKMLFGVMKESTDSTIKF